jgi:acyl carrier protein
MKNKAKTLPESNLKELLRKYINESFLPQAGLETFDDSDSFMEEGIVDSTGVLELLEFIEGEFGIKVEDEEVVPENLDSLKKLTLYIETKLGHAG